MPASKRTAPDMDNDAGRKRLKLAGSRSAVTSAAPVVQAETRNVPKHDHGHDQESELAPRSERANDHNLALISTYNKEFDTLRQTLTCKICERLFYEPYVLACGHTYCYSCLAQWFKANSRKPCPNCREKTHHMPAPSWVVKEMVAVFMKRQELLPDGETVEMHQQWQKEEADLVSKDKEGLGLFPGSFWNGGEGPRPVVRDVSDNVNRCPNCHWELEHGYCSRCEADFDLSTDLGSGSGSDTYDSDSDGDEDDESEAEHTEPGSGLPGNGGRPPAGVRRRRIPHGDPALERLVGDLVRDADDWYDDEDPFPQFEDEEGLHEYTAGLQWRRNGRELEDAGDGEDDEEDIGSLQDFIDDEVEEDVLESSASDSDGSADETSSNHDTVVPVNRPPGYVPRFRRAILDDEDDEDDDDDHPGHDGGTLDGNDSSHAASTMPNGTDEDNHSNMSPRYSSVSGSGTSGTTFHSFRPGATIDVSSEDSDSEPEVMSSRQALARRSRAGIPTIDVDSDDEDDDDDENESEDEAYDGHDGHDHDEERLFGDVTAGFSPLASSVGSEGADYD